MRKITAILLALCLVVLLSACSGTVPALPLRGDGNVVEHTITLDPQEEFFILTIENINFRNSTARIVINETLGNEIIISTDENIWQELRTSVESNQSEVRIYSQRNRAITPTELTITTGLPVTELRGNGAWHVEHNHTRITSFAARMDGSVRGEFNFGELESLHLTLNGAGNISLYGNAQHAQFTLNGAGELEAFGLTAETAAVTLNGAGRVSITATEQLDAAINGTGQIIYDGNPTISRRITGIGRVRAR